MAWEQPSSPSRSAVDCSGLTQHVPTTFVLPRKDTGPMCSVNVSRTLRSLYIIYYFHKIYIYIYIIEGSLEVKLPTMWTDGQAEVGRVREETRREEERKRKRGREEERKRGREEERKRGREEERKRGRGEEGKRGREEERKRGREEERKRGREEERKRRREKIRE